LQDSEKALHRQMADAASDHTELLALDVTLRDLLAARAELETEWLETASLLED
jgi:hypothetical protein